MDLNSNNCYNPILTLRIVTLAVIMAINIFHVKTILVFKVEQILSSGTYIAYMIILFGMTLAMTLDQRINRLLELYYLIFGACLFLFVGIYALWRWNKVDRLTEAVAELLEILGNPVKRNNKCKAACSIVIAMLLLTDTIWIFSCPQSKSNKKYE